MARARSKSTAQRIADMALMGAPLMGMPALFRGILGSRSGSPLFLLLVTGLFVTGIMTIQWTNGRPSLELDRQRATAVKQAVQDRVAAVGDRWIDQTAETWVPESLRRYLGHGSPAATGPLAPPFPTDSVGFTPPPPSTPTYRPPQSIGIASFNVQVFGITKLHNMPVAQLLAEVVRRFDVVAIQEIRCSDDTLLPQFMALVNATGARYDFVLGPRLGRTSSKEQYAVLFDTTRIEVDPRSVYTVPDPQDRLHREPLVARFRASTVPPEVAFTFTLVDIHTDPDETATELDALAEVFASVQRNGSGEDDVILLGDLNVDEQHLGQLGRLPGITWAISGVATNTRGDRMYDNLVFDRRTTVEYTGRSGVFDLTRAFGLNQQQALQVSDHFPVWAEFSAYEGWNGAPVASQPGGRVR